MSPSSNTSIGATGTPRGPPQKFQPHHFQPPMWPGPYYVQHPPTGLPGMFYPHNWGEYTYPMQQHAHMPIHDDRMAVNDDTARQNQVVPNSLGTNIHPSTNSKGKKKASDEELQQQADEERIHHSNNIQCDIEGESIPPEVLAIARRIHESDHLSKQPKPPPTGPAVERRVHHSSNTTQVDNKLMGYLSDPSKCILANSEQWSSQPKTTKLRKKEPTKMEYLAPRDGAAYLRDSRVHNGTITEGSSMEDWITFLTGTMGMRPIHPDEPRLSAPTEGSSDSNYSDEDNEDDSESWSVKWHKANPLPKNTPSYKLREQEIFLKAEQAKFNNWKRDRRLNEYNMAIARPPPSLPSVTIAGQLERDNGFWGMLGPRFLYLQKYNIVLANTEAASTLTICTLEGIVHPLGSEWIPHFKSASPTLGDIYFQWHSPLKMTIEVYGPLIPDSLQEYYNMLKQLDWDGPGHDMEEDDVIQHMADNVHTLMHSHLSTDSTHANFYLEVNQLHHVLLNTYGTPPTLDSHLGWWYPDAHDIEHRRVLHHVQDYKAPDRHLSTEGRRADRKLDEQDGGSGSNRTLYEWFHIGEHYLYKWLVEHPPPEDTCPVSDASLTPHPIIASDEDVVMDHHSLGSIPVAGSRLALASNITRQDGTVVSNITDMARSLDMDIGHACPDLAYWGFPGNNPNGGRVMGDDQELSPTFFPGPSSQSQGVLTLAKFENFPFYHLGDLEGTNRASIESLSCILSILSHLCINQLQLPPQHINDLLKFQEGHGARQEEEEEGPVPNVGATSRQNKEAAGSKAKGKVKLAFEVTHSKDHDRIWDSTIVEEKITHNHDGEYSIDNLGSDTPTYDLDALLGNQSPLPTSKPTLPTKPQSTVLLGESYVPITGFQVNPAFDSIQGNMTSEGQPAATAPSGGECAHPPSRPTSQASTTSISMVSQSDLRSLTLVKPILGVSTDSSAKADVLTVFEEMLGNEKMSSEATQAELDKLSEYQLTLSLNEYIRQYNAELTTLVMGRGMHQSEEPIQVKEEVPNDGPFFEDQCAALQERMSKGKKPNAEEPSKTTNCKDKTTSRPSTASAVPALVNANITLPDDESMGTRGTTKSPSEDLQNRIALQWIHLSQIKDGYHI
ncbi:hypothetical protein ARMGADRAFT_1035877 [Armillaria gallica]|uniref:Uncharacterized protein n=1 Tax=Armillaria gallica TaxID=47427 RepID=A0A2H3D436_ARMGA|nr:hypothetical protein ARMGADRAFT_1035877 [Armillaria gallica]